MAVEQTGPQLPEWPQLSGPHVSRYLFAAGFAPGKRVLDAGCGIGYGSVLLRDAGAAGVTAVDLNPDILRQAADRYQNSGVDFKVDDCQTLCAVNGPFDLICSFEQIEHLPQPRQFLASALRLLAPGGVLLVSTPERDASDFTDGKPRNPFHVQEWRRDEFRQLLAEFFGNIDLRVQIRATALESRLAGVAELRRYLSWANPVAKFIWRNLLRNDDGPAWNRLKLLAAAGPADYPIVSAVAAPILGTPQFNVGICRK